MAHIPRARACAIGLDFPSGGFNASGYGKEGGIAGIEEFTRVKQIGIRSRATAPE